MRLSRKNWTEKDKGLSGKSVADLLDYAARTTFRITQEEFEYILRHASGVDLDMILYDDNTFAARRKSLQTLFKYLNDFKNHKK